MRVIVCIITYRRPEGLKRLLEGLDRLTFREEVAAPEVEVLVVDNDPAGSARTLVKRERPRLRWPIEYDVEPERGIPYARNRAITLAAQKDAGLLVFVDDDEVPRPSWMDELLRVQRSCHADVVYGAVLPRFEDGVPSWVVEGEFFEHPFVRAGYETGLSLELADTNNVLVRTTVFEEMGKNFDERFALTGGSDTHFFMRAFRAGYKIVWAADAVVDDWIPARRASARWILQRAYRLGNTRSLCELDLRTSSAGWITPGLKGAGRIAQGIVLMPVSVLSGRRGLVSAAHKICYGAGRLAGFFGVRYEEYRRTQGA
ncbi:MAG: glycosyltransferase [Actinomycetota bacterium]|nr:glycosyltransferase [Actinomycetota bacterium]